MNALSFLNIREQMCDIARLLWERRLTNAYGGNISVRTGESNYLITPSLMAEEMHNLLTPDDLILIGFDGVVLEGSVNVSRENDMHAALLTTFP